MKTLDVLYCEVLKLRRSPMPPLSLGSWGLGILFIAFFMWMVLNPGEAAKFGLIGDKASFTFGGEGRDWSGYLHVVLMLGAILGLLFSSFILSWIFGREYVEGTAKNLLALPTPRRAFVFAKFAVALLWFALLVALGVGGALLAGALLGLPGWSPGLGFEFLGRFLFVSALAFLVSFPAAWIALATRGYLGALGYTIGVMFIGNFFSHTGWAPFCPWTVVLLVTAPGLGGGPAIGEGTAALGAGSYLVVLGTALLALGASLFVVERSDNAQ